MRPEGRDAVPEHRRREDSWRCVLYEKVRFKKDADPPEPPAPPTALEADPDAEAPRD